jgi:hypothetical protein
MSRSHNTHIQQQTTPTLGPALGIGLLAGTVMSIGYIYVLVVVAWAHSHQLSLAQDPVNTPTPFLMTIYFVCQLAGLSLLGWTFLAFRHLWKSLLAVGLSLALAAIVVLSIPVLRRPDLLPLMIYAAVGLGLGCLANRKLAILMAIVAPGIYWAAALLDHSLHVSDAIARGLTVNSDPDSFEAASTARSTMTACAAQIIMNVIFAIGTATVLRTLHQYRANRAFQRRESQ